MNEIAVVERATDWRRLKALVLDSVSSPITKRVTLYPLLVLSNTCLRHRGRTTIFLHLEKFQSAEVGIFQPKSGSSAATAPCSGFAVNDSQLPRRSPSG